MGSLAPMSLPRAVAVGGVVLLGGALGCGLVLGAAAAGSGLASAGRLHSPEGVPARDVAIVFGAQVYSDGTPAPYTAARLDVGAALYAAGKARVLLVSGDDRPEHNRETTAMRRYLQARGVPASRIVEDTAGRDTYDTCLRARDTFGVREAILVTQAYHLPRAISACRALGVDAVGVGDSSVRDEGDFWAYGAAREVPATVKLALDLVRRRPPAVQDPPSAAIRDALAS
jgi:vancomycin permeability regulator SanA